MADLAEVAYFTQKTGTFQRKNLPVFVRNRKYF